MQERFYPNGGQIGIALWSFIDTSNHLSKRGKILSRKHLKYNSRKEQSLGVFNISKCPRNPVLFISLCLWNSFVMLMEIFLKWITHSIHVIINSRSSVCRHNTHYSKRSLYLGTTKWGHVFSLPIKWEHMAILKLNPLFFCLSCHILLFHLCQCVLLHLICGLIFLGAVSLSSSLSIENGWPHVSLLFC